MIVNVFGIMSTRFKILRNRIYLKYIGYRNPIYLAKSPPPLRNDPHHFLIVYDAQCSESNENMNKQFFRFLFFELSSIFHSIFSEKSPQFSMITRKKKIGNFFYSHSRSIQNIAHHIQSKKEGVISEGGRGSACPSL